ncbi:MAG: MgtC/SapB family protein [Melioribacteraceae bacterium]|nr:MgtC/SapB family protein [Melioribacteraceae bacterium]
MEAIEWTVQLRLAVALALGFLVGLERESSQSKHKKVLFGGIRTYPIISMLGFGCAWLFTIGEKSLLPIGLIALAALTAISYFSKFQFDQPGVTTELSALLTFIVGALAMLVDIWASMALGIINTMLLSEKARLEEFVEKLDRVEFLAVLKFLLVTLIILPVLPNEEYTQFKVNPSKVWQIVIIVSSIGFVGYILSKRMGEKVGFWLSGLVGGIVSSTAVSIAYGRMTKQNELISKSALQGVIVAASVMYLRLLILIYIINPRIVAAVWWQMILLSGAGFAISLLKFRTKKHKVAALEESQRLQNPFEIRPAFLFALLFVALSFITGLVKEYFGQSGIISLSVLVGITDISPFVLSLISSSEFSIGIISAAILVSIMSNTVMKGIYFGYLANNVRKETFIRFGILALLHIPVIVITLFL